MTIYKIHVNNRDYTSWEIYDANKFTKIDRIAFACHGSSKPNMFLDNNPLFTETDLSSSVYSSNCNNIINIINTYSVVNIDFLGCNTLQYDNWKAYYKL